MSDDNVIRTFPKKGLPECPVEVGQRFGYCRHRSIMVVEHDRQVICTECNATLDAFDYLRGEALAIRRGWESYRHVEQLCNEKQQRIADLEKERKRLTAQVKRLKGKAQGVAIDVRKPL